MQEKFISNYGEVVNKKDLMDEIESLLNRFNDSSPKSNLNSTLMESLDIQTLHSIRDSLLAKCGQELENNIEWLHTLKNKNE